MTTVAESHRAMLGKLTIDHSRIDPTLLAAEREIETLSPERKVYPWTETYPLAGQTVYCGGQLWTVGEVTGPDYNARYRGELSSPRDVLRLSRTQRTKHGDTCHSAQALRSELRPVTWTQADEDKLP